MRISNATPPHPASRTWLPSTAVSAVLALASSCSLAASALAQGLPRARPEEVGLSDSALKRIAPAFQAYVDSGKLPGFLAIVARHGKLAYVASLGWMDVEHQRTMRSDAVFRIYSMTKPITSAAVLQLYERGALRLEDPVSKYIPAFAHVKVYVGGGAAMPVLQDPERPIGLADLLTHTAGLSYDVIGNTPVDSIYLRRLPPLFVPRLTLAQLSDTLARLPLKFSPGTRWQYSYATDVLARVVEVVSGMSFDRYLDSALFRPLGMTMTAFHVTPRMEGHLTTLYTRGPDGKLRPDSPFVSLRYTPEGRWLSGGGGLLSTVGDYLRFAQMLLNRGELDGHRVLKPETVDLMMQDHLPRGLTPLALPVDSFIGKSGFGYGGAVRVDSDTAVPASPGTFRWGGAATTFFWVDPKADLIAMLWTQYTPVSQMFWLDGQFQRLVYAAVRK